MTKFIKFCFFVKFDSRLKSTDQQWMHRYWIFHLIRVSCALQKINSVVSENECALLDDVSCTPLLLLSHADFIWTMIKTRSGKHTFRIMLLPGLLNRKQPATSRESRQYDQKCARGKDGSSYAVETIPRWLLWRRSALLCWWQLYCTAKTKKSVSSESKTCVDVVLTQNGASLSPPAISSSSRANKAVIGSGIVSVWAKLILLPTTPPHTYADWSQPTVEVFSIQESALSMTHHSQSVQESALSRTHHSQVESVDMIMFPLVWDSFQSRKMKI